MSTLTSTLADEEHKLLACVHCGLCLDACPTYVATGDENDSPRGRLYLMRAVAEGRLTHNSLAFENHIDRCLGCRACESVCPAGVEYGILLEASRSELFPSQSARGIEYRFLSFALRHIWRYPRRLQFFFFLTRLFRSSGLPILLRKSGIARALSSRLVFALALLESSGGRSSPVVSGDIHMNEDEQRPAMLFKGCVGEGLFKRVNDATRRVLKMQGYKLEVPSEQVCCGALHAHAGDLEGARELARKNVAAFASEENVSVVTNAGGCGAMLKSYGHLLFDDPDYSDRATAFSKRIRDISELVSDIGSVKPATASNETVTYDASCHLLYGQHAADDSLRMLQSVGDLQFVPLPGAERCCGGAGIYNLLEPELSQKVLREKIEGLKGTGARTLATGNPGCQMQIGAGAKLAGLDVRICHPVELLDEWYQRSGRYQG